MISCRSYVAPRAGAWIETEAHGDIWEFLQRVAPRAGAWIETASVAPSGSMTMSHPVRVRGLKLRFGTPFSNRRVAPRAGAWIETTPGSDFLRAEKVAPRAGAWIETSNPAQDDGPYWSHPVRVRGLKLRYRPIRPLLKCRTPCGCVD